MHEEDDINIRLYDWYGENAPPIAAVQAIMALQSLLLLICLMALLQLAGLHAWLAYYGMTTYDYILHQRRRIMEESAGLALSPWPKKRSARIAPISDIQMPKLTEPEGAINFAATSDQESQSTRSNRVDLEPV
jgi:hypothetical protein